MRRRWIKASFNGVVRPMGKRMGEIVSLRKVRKDHKKRKKAKRAAVNRIVHGRSKVERTSETKGISMLNRHLDRHKIESGDA